MLEHVPHWLGGLLRNIRAGHDKLVIVQPGIAQTDARIDLSSPAFANGARLPDRFTADGAGTSPPLIWTDPPERTVSFALIVEDPDAPAGRPLVHAIVWNMPARERRLAEGAISRDGEGEQMDAMSDATASGARAGCRPIRRPAMAAMIMSSSCSPYRPRHHSAPIQAALPWSRPCMDMSCQLDC
jgi:phosphatidylethanolamine-binding protein (PEBP) family uncharacterized protein